MLLRPALPLRCCSSAPLLADPAIIYDLGGKFDKSFNEAAFNGAEAWKKATGGSYTDLELQNAQREQGPPPLRPARVPAPS